MITHMKTFNHAHYNRRSVLWIVGIIVYLILVTAIASRGAEYTVTAYCSCEKCCGKWSNYNKTADGHTPKQGVTCAASRAIPFGTRLKIEGVGTRIVQDRLAVRYDSRIDIYFTNHTDALKFGKKKLKVTIDK